MSPWALPQCHVNQLWWTTPVVPALGRWRPERQELKVSLGYMLKGVSPLHLVGPGDGIQLLRLGQAAYSLSRFAGPVLTFLEPLLCLVG